MFELLLAATVAGLVSVASVPLVSRLAQSRGLLDRPDAGRRWHRVAVPRVGGIAVWLGAVAGVAALVAVAGLPSLAPGQLSLVGAFAISVGIMFVVGLYDDLRDLSPRAKLVAQCLAAVIVVAGGFRIETIALGSEVSVSLGWLSIPITLLWIVGVTNAFNLVDGLDGLAGGVASVALIAIALASVLLGNPVVLALIVPLAAAIAGFLWHNVSPARIFLGDVGSLTLGLALAVLTVEGTRRPDGATHFPVALFAVAFPLLDTCTAMLRRWLRGVPVSSADDRHVHHQLVALGLSHRRAAALIWLFAVAVAGFGLSISLAPPAFTLLVVGFGAAAFVLIVVHGARWLHYHEFAEAQASFASGLWTARSVIRDRIRAREVANDILASASVSEVQAVLDAHGAALGFESLSLCDATDLRVRLAVSQSVMERRQQLIVPIISDDPEHSGRLLILAAWRPERRRPPLYAERVMRILAPAVATALAKVAPALPGRAVEAIPVGGNGLRHLAPSVALRSRPVADAAPL